MRTAGLCMLWIAVTGGLAAGTPDERVIVTSGGLLTEIPYATGLTASKAIMAAGGYSDFSSASIHLIRCGRSTRLDIDAVFRGQRQNDVQLRPWDIITIGNTIVHRK